MIQYFHDSLWKSVSSHRQRMLERIQIKAFVRRIVVDIQKNMYSRIAEIETEKIDNMMKQKQLEEEKNNTQSST